MSSDSAVSELIGAILLVSIVALGVMIVSVSILSQPPPSDIPQLTARADNVSKTVYLYHDGGNSLQPEEIKTIVNGQESSFSLAGGENWPWSVGKTLEIDYTGPGMPEYVQLIYTGGSTQTLILTDYFVPPMTTGGPTTIPTQIPTTVPTTIPTTLPTTGPTPDSTPTTTVTTTPTTPIPTCGYISGTKYNDQNGNGNKDTGEPGLPNWEMKCYSKPNAADPWSYVSTTYTNSEGDYIFTNLVYHPDTFYKIEETVQSGWTPTNPASGINEDQLNNGHCYRTGLDFGNRQVSPPGPIHGNTIIFNKAAGGYMVDGTYIQFVIPKTGNPQFNLEIDGDEISIKKGDVIKLVIHNNQNTGQADITSSQITRFNFYVDAYVDNTLEGTGQVTGVQCIPFESFTSTLAFHMPSQLASTNLRVDGVYVIPWWPYNSDIVDLTNIGIPADNQARIDISSTSTYIDCSGDYQITSP